RRELAAQAPQQQQDRPSSPQPVAARQAPPLPKRASMPDTEDDFGISAPPLPPRRQSPPPDPDPVPTRAARRSVRGAQQNVSLSLPPPPDDDDAEPVAAKPSAAAREPREARDPKASNAN